MNGCHTCRVTRWKLYAATLHTAGRSMETLQTELTRRGGQHYKIEIRQQAGVRLLVSSSQYGVDVLLREATK